jgi:hypothetical protein
MIIDDQHAHGHQQMLTHATSPDHRANPRNATAILRGNPEPSQAARHARRGEQ